MSSDASNSLSNILCIIVLCTFSLVLTMVDSKVIKVGDNRWDDSTNYVSWAEQYNFTVGDVLVFSYAQGAHNVYEVTKATFQSCNTSTGVDAKYESGDDEIVLKVAKPYWFICTVDNHCRLGMKLAINVTEAATNLSPAIQPVSNKNYAPKKRISGRNFFVAVGFLSILMIVC